MLTTDMLPNHKERWITALIAFVSGIAGMLFAAGVTNALSVRMADAAASPRPAVVSALVMVDSNGVKRAELHTVGAQPQLDFYGRSGVTRISLGIGPTHNSARIRFYSERGTPQAAIGVTAEGRAGVALLDTAQRLRTTLDVSTDGEPALRLYNDQVQPIIGLSVTAAGMPGLALISDAGKIRAALDLQRDGVPTLEFYDANGHAIRELP